MRVAATVAQFQKLIDDSLGILEIQGKALSDEELADWIHTTNRLGIYLEF